MKEPRVRFVQSGEIAILRFDDSIEVYHAEAIRQQIVDLVERDAFTKVVFSLEEVPYVDSSGLGVFLNVIHNYGDRVQFRFCCLSENVKSVFRFANLLSYFVIDETEDESLRALEATPAT